MPPLDATPGVEVPPAQTDDSHRPSRPRGHGTAAGLGAVCAVAAVATWVAAFSAAASPLVVGAVLGVVVANVIAVPDRWSPGIRFAARTVLRAGIVLLGFRLAVGDLAALGGRGLLVVAAVVTVTFVGTRWLARRLGVPDDLGLLVATGYAICGASAIAAMDGVTRSDEEESAYAIALVTLCGTLSIGALPLLAGSLGFAGESFGTWVGAAVHDVGQVVAAAAVDGEAAVEAATVVKLTRVVLLAPLVAAVAIARRRRDRCADALATTGSTQPPLVPLFVVGFLAAIAVRSSGVLGDQALDTIAGIEKVVLTVALVGLGMGVRVTSLRRLGGRPLVLGLLAWVLVAGTAAAATIVIA